MSRLILVRHGQVTSYVGDRGGLLSELGHEQAALLGQRWAGRALELDRVLVGPCERHQQTLDAVDAAFEQAGLALPAAESALALDEYPAVELITRAGRAAFAEAGSFDAMFEQLMRRYASGELSYDDVETFEQFRARVGTQIDEITSVDTKGQTVAAFTSGGVIAAAVGHVLSLPGDRVVELSWMVANGSITELAFRPGRLSLASFNRHPHLESAQLLTLR